jgi:hypothetical protein
LVASAAAAGYLYGKPNVVAFYEAHKDKSEV